MVVILFIYTLILGFVDLPLRYIKPILASDKLNVRCESEVLSAAIEWINHHESSSPKDLTDVMECIRLPLVPHKVLLDVEENQQELFTSAGETCKCAWITIYNV